MISTKFNYFHPTVSVVCYHPVDPYYLVPIQTGVPQIYHLYLRDSSYHDVHGDKPEHVRLQVQAFKIRITALC